MVLAAKEDMFLLIALSLSSTISLHSFENSLLLIKCKSSNHFYGSMPAHQTGRQKTNIQESLNFLRCHDYFFVAIKYVLK